MICKPCRDRHYNLKKLSSDYTPTVSELKSIPFVFGSVSYHIESLRSHCKATNTDHYLAVTRKINIEKENSQQEKLSDIQRIKVALTDAQKKHLTILFINAYGILKRGKPFSDFEFLI